MFAHSVHPHLSFFSLVHTTPPPPQVWTRRLCVKRRWSSQGVGDVYPTRYLRPPAGRFTELLEVVLQQHYPTRLRVAVLFNV
jgi:hypothetical protein